MKYSHRIYYADVSAVLIGIMAGVGSLAIVAGRALGRSSEYWISLSGLFIALAALSLSPRVMNSRQVSWLGGACAALTFAALVVVFSQWPLVWAVAAIGLCSALLTVALVKGSVTLSQPLSRHDFFKLAAVVVGLGVAFGAAEALVRLFPGLFPEEIQQALRADPRNYGVAHPYIGHLHTPNATIVVSGRDFKAFHHTDALGFRNDWPWPARAETVVVGDSVAFGYGVADAEAWPAILGRALPRAGLVNLSLIGGGPQQYLRVYETFGAQLQPKLVLVGVWTLNDFANARTFEDWQRSGVGGNYMVFREFGGTRAVALQRRHLSARIEAFFDWEVYPLFRRSHLVNLARVVGESMSRTGLTPARTVEFSDGSRLELIPEDLARASALGQPDRREFHLLVDALQRLHSAARASGAHALMILQPAKEEIYLPLLGDSATDPTHALRAEFDRRGIEYLDLAPAFRQRAAAGERLFFEKDSHPNAAGYDLIAHRVRSHIHEHRERYGVGQ